MTGFYKFMVVSACILLALSIFLGGSKTFKESTLDKVIWLILDAYAIGLLYIAIKIIGG